MAAGVIVRLAVIDGVPGGVMVALSEALSDRLSVNERDEERVGVGIVVIVALLDSEMVTDVLGVGDSGGVMVMLELPVGVGGGVIVTELD